MIYETLDAKNPHIFHVNLLKPWHEPECLMGTRLREQSGSGNKMTKLQKGQEANKEVCLGDQLIVEQRE